MGETPAAPLGGADDENEYDSSTRRHRLHRAAHHAEAAYLITLPGMIGAQWLPDGWWVGQALNVVATGGSVLCLGLMVGWHTGRMCEACISAMPLNGSELAERKRPWLRMFHKVYDAAPGKLLMRFVAMYAVYLLLIWWGAEEVGQTLFMGSVGVILFMALRHKRLQQWCPWCRRRWGWDGEGAPVAPPVPTADKS